LLGEYFITCSIYHVIAVNKTPSPGLLTLPHALTTLLNVQAPDHKNDDPDWDAEEWIPYKRPYVPNFLFYAFGVAIIGVMVTAWYIMQYRKRLLNEVHSYRVIPSSDEETQGILMGGEMKYQSAS